MNQRLLSWVDPLPLAGEVDEDQVVVEEVGQLVDVPFRPPAPLLQGPGVDLVLGGLGRVRLGRGRHSVSFLTRTAVLGSAGGELQRLVGQVQLADDDWVVQLLGTGAVEAHVVCRPAVRNSWLRVDSSPIRFVSGRSWGLRPASARRTATMSFAVRSQSGWKSVARGSRKVTGGAGERRRWRRPRGPGRRGAARRAPARHRAARGDPDPAAGSRLRGVRRHGLRAGPHGARLRGRRLHPRRWRSRPPGRSGSARSARRVARMLRSAQGCRCWRAGAVGLFRSRKVSPSAIVGWA
jgi:hypothetical protein